MHFHFHKEGTILQASFWVVFLLLCSFLSYGYASQLYWNKSVLAVQPEAQSCISSFSFESKYMGFNVPCMIYLPIGYNSATSYPVWYGLHGNSSSETMWLQTAGIGSVADKLIKEDASHPIIMVFPFVRYDSAKTIQEDMKDGIRSENLSEQYICKELIPYVDSKYSTIQSPDGRFIGGFSMGGLFSLQIALHHPDLFGKVGGYSPALVYSDFSDERFETWMNNGNPTNATADIAHYAKNKGLEKLQVYIDYGKDGDPFAKGAQSLNEALLRRGINSKLYVHGGGHSLQIDKLEEYLRFYIGK